LQHIFLVKRKELFMAQKPSENLINRRNAPDPADSYERARPGHEAGMGRLDNNDDAVPEDRADVIQNAVHNRQDPTHQINADEEDRHV
jgi:hypothetical protein